MNYHACTFGVRPSSSGPLAIKLQARQRKEADEELRARLISDKERVEAEQRKQIEARDRAEREKLRRARLASMELKRMMLERAWKKEAPRITGREIMENVAAARGTTVLALQSAERTAALVRVRHEAMYLVAANTLMSLPAIGKIFGNRDHTTVYHGIKKHAERNGLPPAREPSKP